MYRLPVDRPVRADWFAVQVQVSQIGRAPPERAGRFVRHARALRRGRRIRSTQRAGQNASKYSPAQGPIGKAGQYDYFLTVLAGRCNAGHPVGAGFPLQLWGGIGWRFPACVRLVCTQECERFKSWCGQPSRAIRPPATRQASIPPWIWRAPASPASCAACTAIAERSPNAQ